VTAAARNAFALQAAAAANRVHGVPVTFRGEEMLVCLAPVAVSLDLDTGGLRQSGEFKARFLASTLNSPPKRGEPVLYNGRTYLVTEVTEPANMPGEHVCTLTPGSKQ
jgi:hypothetical protein